MTVVGNATKGWANTTLARTSEPTRRSETLCARTPTSDATNAAEFTHIVFNTPISNKSNVLAPRSPTDRDRR